MRDRNNAVTEDAPVAHEIAEVIHQNLLTSTMMTAYPEEGSVVSNRNSEIITNVASVQNADELYELLNNEIEDENNISREQLSATELESLNARSCSVREEWINTSPIIDEGLPSATNLSNKVMQEIESNPGLENNEEVINALQNVLARIEDVQ